MTATLPRLLTYREVQAATGLASHQLEKAVAKGLIPHIRIGRRVYFEAGQLQAWAARGGQPLPAKTA